MLFIIKLVITVLFAYLWYRLAVLHKATDTEFIVGLACIIVAFFVSRIEWKIFGKEINKKSMSKYNLVSDKKWWEFWK